MLTRCATRIVRTTIRSPCRTEARQERDCEVSWSSEGYILPLLISRGHPRGQDPDDLKYGSHREAAIQAQARASARPAYRNHSHLPRSAAASAVILGPRPPACSPGSREGWVGKRRTSGMSEAEQCRELVRTLIVPAGVDVDLAERDREEPGTLSRCCRADHRVKIEDDQHERPSALRLAPRIVPHL